MPLIGMAGIASAAKVKAAPHCAQHPHKAACLKSGAGGGATGGTGGTAPNIVVSVSPNPLVETGQSEVHAVIQVQTQAAFAGDDVNIDSSRLEASCLKGIKEFENLESGGTTADPHTSLEHIDAVLDDDGNATVVVEDGVDVLGGRVRVGRGPSGLEVLELDAAPGRRPRAGRSRC